MNRSLGRLHLSDEIKRFGERWSLTPRERDVLNLIALGTTRIKDVAAQLALSPNTVNNHVNSIFAKTQTRSKSELLTRLLSDLTEELLLHRLHHQSPRVLILAPSADADEMRAAFEARRCRAAIMNDVSRTKEVLRMEPVTFVIVDLDWPAADVTSLLSIMSEPPMSWTKVLAIGTGRHPEERARLMDQGAIELLEKPVNFETLYRRLMAYYTESSESLAQFEAELLALQAKGRATIELTPESAGRGGVFLASDELSRSIHSPVGVGDRVDFELRLSGTTASIQAHGEIVWVRESEDGAFRAGAGVRLVTLSPTDRARLERYSLDHRIRSFIPLGMSPGLGK